MSATVRLRLLVTCPDRPGIIHAVARFLSESGANIVRSDQYSTDPEGGTFFLRMEFALAPERRHGLAERFGLAVAEPFGMTWRLWDAAEPKRVGILVSRYEHCLVDLLWRWRHAELEARIVLVASNHSDLRNEVESFHLPYHYVPVEPDGKPEAEARLLHLLAGRCDVVVLARYMQILSSDFLERLGAGPIIEQDVIRVTHRDDAGTLARLGADIERTALSHAVMWHCADRVLRHGNTTVVF